MKAKTIILLSAFCVFGCKSAEESKTPNSTPTPLPAAVVTEAPDNLIPWFDGEWFYSVGIKTVFDLELIVLKDGTVKGKICCSLNEGKREDCSQDDYNLRGTIKGDCIEATFYSMHSPDKPGEASICKVSDNQIAWTITKTPDGLYEILNEVTLYKLEKEQES